MERRMMREGLFRIGTQWGAALAALVLATAETGCFDFPSCEELLTCGIAGDGIPPECIPDEANPEMSDLCGLFVSASKGSDANPGTKDKPFASLSKSIVAAQGRPVYACAEDGKPFDEAVVIDTEVM
jgi:hypothetical protein